VRALLPLLLLASAAITDEPAVLGDARTFELPLPAGGDWESLKPDGEAKAYARTEFLESNPKAAAEVRVMTYALPAAMAARGLDAIARQWAPAVEAQFPDPKTVGEGKSSLGGEEAWFRDVRAAAGRLTWHVARAGETLYVFHVIRTNKAIDDADVEEEVAGMRAAFRFLKPQAPEAARPPEPPPVEAALARATLEFDHWRFACVKPEGVLQVPPEKLDRSERDAGVVTKFERTVEDGVFMVRIYAQSMTARKFTIDQLADQKLRRFEETYDETHRLPPRRDAAWKPPLAERAIRLELTGRGRTTQLTRWYLAECGNGRQYQIEVYVAGDAERWSKETEQVLEGFEPKRP
jgi:hypothetical protein